MNRDHPSERLPLSALDGTPPGIQIGATSCRFVVASARDPRAPHGNVIPMTHDASRPSRADLTQYLIDLSAGAASADSPLLAYVYDELKAIASSYSRRSGGVDESLAATALVHEAYLKLFHHQALDLKSRGHFFALAAKAMRQLLVDHARHRRRVKRGGDRKREPLDDAVAAVEAMNIDVLDLEDALLELATLDALQAEVVELRFFAGLEIEEIGSLLELSRHAVDRKWRAARAWLGHRLGREPR